VSGDFVVDHEDPQSAQVHLRVRAGVTIDDSLLELVGWMGEESNSERLSCHLSALVEFPDDDPKIHLIKEFERILFDSFTAHGDKGKKGFPILPVP
jgi:hypothetical protein